MENIRILPSLEQYEFRKLKTNKSIDFGRNPFIKDRVFRVKNGDQVLYIFSPERKNQRNRMDAGNHPGGCNFVPDFPDVSGAEMGASTGPLAFRRSRGPRAGAA